MKTKSELLIIALCSGATATMKKKLAMFSVVLCSLLATMSAFGQTTYTWTNATATDIGLRAGWNPNGLPSGATQDTAQWDGVVPGNLILSYITGWGNSGFGTSGINLLLTANQTGNVTILGPSTGNSPAVGIFGITNDSATAVLYLGDSTAHQLSFATRPGTAGTVHGFVNNSANAAVMDTSVNWIAGGGVNCVMEFGGTGDWIVNNNLRDNNSGAGPISITLDGPGSLIWSPGGVWLASDAVGPITINGGTLSLKGAGLCPSFTIYTDGTGPGNNTITDGGTLKYDAVGISDNISRVIQDNAGLALVGAVQVNNGTLTLSGANTYTGNTILSGGELIVNAPEINGTSGPLGVGGTISFTGGTLGFSSANTYDYSSRFASSASQSFSFDTAGQNVTFANGLASSGGAVTKLGPGTLTLAGANTYNGATTVSAGKLVIQGSQASGSITVANSAALGVNQGGQQITPGTLTVGTSAGATLEFNNVNSTTTAAIATGTLAAGGTITVNINSGTFLQGSSYPLLQWTSGSFTAGSFALGTVTGAGGNLTVSGNTLYLNVTALASTWTGNVDAIWSATSGTLDWKAGGSPSQWIDGAPALFDDTVTTANTNITLGSTVVPSGVTVNNSTVPYTITSSSGNVISGSSGLTKAGNGTLTLSGGVNTYSGATTVSGGILSIETLAASGTPSDIGEAGSAAANLVLNGGTLQLTASSGTTSDHLFTLGTAGGTIDDEGSGLTLNNSGSIAMNGTGARTLTLTGAGSDELDAALNDNGGATALTKNGAGTWVLTGTNSQSGVTTIASGTLQVGKGGATGSLGSGSVVDNGSLDFNVSSTLTVGTITGTGSVTNDGSGTLILPGNNNYQAGTTINNGTVQVGTGGAAGTLDAAANILDNGTLIFNSTGNSTISAVISGTGQLIKRGSGLLQFIGNNTYTGPTTIDTGAQLQLWQGNTGATTSSAITNNGTLIMMRQDNGVAIYSGPISGTGKLMLGVSNGNDGDSTLTGTNTYTGGTYFIGGGLILGDNATPGAGAIVGNVFLTNDYVHATFSAYEVATITFNRPDDFTFPGNIVGDGALTHEGYGTLTLTGVNNYTNGTTISQGILQVGAGGTSGSIGTGPVTDNYELVFNRSDAVTFGNAITGAGQLVKFGSGSLTLTSTNLSYTGNTTVSNGTLVVTGGSLAGYVYVEGGTLVPASLSTGGTLNMPNGYLSMDSGTLLVPLNRSLTGQTNIVAGYGINYNGGTLAVTNVGSPLVVGDKFYLFSQPVTGIASVSGAGATWQNDLATDGSITALTVPKTVNTNAPVVQVSVSGGNTLNLAWPANLGWTLQTNSAGIAAANQWFSYPGSTTVTNVSITINPAITNVFFRMVYTNQ